MSRRRSTLPLLLICVVACANAAPAPPVRIILVGDSTMASSTGYGDALCARFSPETACINLARGGRSSGSFRAEGRWDEVQALLRDSSGFGATYVLIQFGHNDQPGKPGRSTDIVHEFPANMARYVAEARQLGAVPVLVTPLTRRSFRGAWLHDDLAPWSALVRRVAHDMDAPLVDLNTLSIKDAQAMGSTRANLLARVGANFDHTHVGPAGAAHYADMVAGALLRTVPALAGAVRSAR